MKSVPGARATEASPAAALRLFPRRGRLAPLSLVWLAACNPVQDNFVQHRFLAMGTWVDVEFESAGRQADSRILESIEEFLDGFERDYYAWSDGELSQINAALSRSQPAPASAGMIELLASAVEISAASEGAFEPGVAGLVELWGFHSSLAEPEQPDASRIEAWLDGRSTIADLRIDEDSVSSMSTALQIDLGAIAKGEAVDRMISLLRTNGVRNALVSAGGDIRVLGRHGERPWRVGIQAPRADGLIGALELDDGEAAFTSGDYERFLENDSGRMHHILDPRTGYPATHTQAVTVIGDSGILADAAATAIFVAGPDEWRETAEALGIRFVLRVDASGATEMTREMSERISGNETAG